MSSKIPQHQTGAENFISALVGAQRVRTAVAACSQHQTARAWVSVYFVLARSSTGKAIRQGSYNLRSQSVMIVQLGSAFLRLEIPFSVTLDRPTITVFSLVIPVRCSNPASVMLVRYRSRVRNPVSSVRCFNPASVIFVSMRLSRCRLVKSCKCFSPSSLMSVWVRSKVRSLFKP